MKEILSCVHISLLMMIGLCQVNAQPAAFQWRVIDPHMLDVKTNTKYGLSNTIVKSFLAYYHRNTGISLAFDHKQTPDNITFMTEGNKYENLKYEQPFAIYIKGGGYIYYRKKDFGINIEYGNKPVYEWKFRNMVLGPQQPKIVKSNDSLILFNTVNSGYLIYGERDYGPNLEWSDMHSIGQISDNSPYYGVIRITVRSGPYKTPSESGKCSGYLTFKFIPLNLTGVNGYEQSFSFGNYYETTQVSTKPLEWWCFISQSVPEIRPGRWKIIVSSSNWSTECEADITYGNNYLTFDQDKNGCITNNIPPAKIKQ